jgi:NADH-quinone oxidoreductase subunit E
MSQLTSQICTQIDQMLAKYPADQRQSAVISALMLVQRQNGGWLTTELMDLVAEYIGMPKIAVYEVASFYTLFHLKPMGKNKISVCTNISCMLRGSDEVVTYLKDKLKIELGETTDDGKFSLKAVECLAACGGAPMMQVNDTYHENLSPDKIDKIIAELK